MPENSSEVDMEGIDLRGSSKSPLDSMGDFGNDGSRIEYMDRRVNDLDITGEEKQVTTGSLSAVTEAKVDVIGSHVSEKTFMDPDVDPALLVKIVVGKIVGKREAGDSLGASQYVGTMAQLAQNSSQSTLTDIGRSEKNASREVDVTFAGLDQLTSWEDSVVAGVITGDYRVEDVSLVSGVVSHPAGLLVDNGSLSSNAPDDTAAEGKALSPAAYLDQASPYASSLVSATLLCGREMPPLDACIRDLTTAGIWETGSEDVGLHCASHKFEADQASLKTGKAGTQKSDCFGVRDVAAAPQSDQETDNCARIAPGMLFDEPPQVSLAEASISCSLIEKKDILTTRLDSEEKDQEVHGSSAHEARTITSVDVIAPTEVAAGARQAASIPSASVRATEGALVARMEKEFVDEDQLVVGEAGDSPLPVDEDGKGGGKVDESSGSMVEVISVRCDMEVSVARRLVAVEVGAESMSRPAEVEVSVSPLQELTRSNISGSEADTRVDTSASECTVEHEKFLMEIAEPKALVRDEEANDVVMKEPVKEEAPSREEEREDIVMTNGLKDESCKVEDAVEGTSQMAEGPSISVQEKEPEVAKGSVDFGITLVGTVESVMKERELDIVKNLVRNLSGGVSTNQEEQSSERNTATNESPNLVRANDSNSTSSSCGSAAQKLEVPVVEDGCIGCGQESKKWRKLILHGLNLLKSVATDIELKQKTTLTSVKGGRESDTSDELKGNGEDESLPETMKTQTCSKSEVGAQLFLEFPKADGSVATTEVEVRSPVAGLTVSHNDEARSLSSDTTSGAKPSEEAGWSEEVNVLETPIFSPQSPDNMQRLDGFRAGSLTNLATDQPEVAGTTAMDLGRPVCISVVQGVFEEGAESSECKDSGDVSPALANEKFETSVTLETTGLIRELHVPVTDEDVKVSGGNVEHDSGGSQHSVVGGPKITREAVKAGPGEQLDYPSLDPQGETCSLDTRAPVIRLETSGKETGAASRPGGQTVFDGSHTFFKSKVEEISHEGDRFPTGLKPMIRVEKVLAISTHDSLPVAKRTLPVVANKEAATKYVMETTLFTSYASEDRKGPARIKRASKCPGDHQEGGRASENELAQEKQNAVGLSARGVFSPACKEARDHLAGGGLENWERPEGMRATDAPITSDLAQITLVDISCQDGEDSVIPHELNSTVLVEAAEDPQQLMSSEEGSVKKNIRTAVEAVGSNPTVVVKKKLQTKRKKFVGETDKKLTKAACLDPVAPVGASTIQGANAVVHEDVGMHGSEELVRVLDDTGFSPTQPEISGADQAVVFWSPEGNCVEGSPTECINGDQTQGLALRCGCGKPAVLKTVGYKSQNRGLRYYSCEKFKPTFFTRKRNRKRDSDNLASCRFFQWLDNPRVTMEDKKEIRLQKRRQLEQILAAKAVTTNYSTRSSSKQELSQYDAERNQRLLQGVPVYGLSKGDTKHENSDEPEPSSKKQKVNRMDPSLSTADSVAFSTRASAARKRKGPCVADTKDRTTPGSSSCGDESSHEVSVGDWNNTIPREVAKRVKSEADKDDTPVHTYSRRVESSRPPRRSGYMLRAKNIGKMERATADTHHVRKLLPVALAYEKSREVVLEESSEEEVSGDQREESNEEENSLQVSSSQEEGVETPISTSAERERTPVKLRSQRASSTAGSGQNGGHIQPRGRLEASKCSLQEVHRDPSGSESSLLGDLHKGTNQSPRWIDVPLTCPFENKESGKSGASGQQAVQHGVGRYGPFAGSHNLVVNFPTASQSGERRTISSNTVLLVKEKAREVSLAVNFKRVRSPATDTESQRVAWSKPADRMKTRAERVDVSDCDDEETGPSGSRGLRSLKDMLKRENSDGTLADYEVADESQPPYCECKTVKRRAALKTVLSNSANHGLRYWVCVNHRPLFQKKSLWEGDPNDESCKFFRWLDTPIISYAERKKKLAARRRRNERRRR